MDLRLIRYFAAVAEAKSFSGGAKLAFVTQPTLSSGIAALEKELGVSLFDRHPRGVRITSDGERLLEHARTILREVQALRTREPKVPGMRRLRVGVLYTVPSWVSASIVRTLQRLAPDVPVFAQEASVTDLRKRLFDGRFDLCLTNLRPLERPFRQQRLFTDRMVVVFGADDADGQRKRIPPEILHDKPLVARTHCEHVFAASRILDSLHVQPRIVLRTADDAHALDFVAHGAGCSLVPDSFRWPGVVLRDVPWMELPRTIGLEWVGGRMDDWLKPKLGALEAAATGGKTPADKKTARPGKSGR